MLSKVFYNLLWPYLCLFLLTISFCYNSPAHAFNESKPPVILVLHSLKAKQPWTLLFNRYFAEKLEQSNLPSYKLEIECLDLLEFKSNEHKDILKQLLYYRYGKLTPDILVVTFDPSLQFVETNNLFPNAPRVVVSPSKPSYKNMKNTVVLPFAYDFKGNIEHCLKILPDTKEIYVVAGNALFDKRTAEKFKYDTKSLNNLISFKYLVGLGAKETIEKVKNLPPDSLVYYLSYSLDSNGKTIVARDFAAMLGKNANRPVLSYFDLFTLNTNILGGRTTTTKASAFAAVSVIEQLAEGKSTDYIFPPVPFFEYIYDWNQLQKWKINQSKLPKESLIQNKPQQLYKRYYKQILWLIFLIAGESFLVIYLFISIRLRKKAEQEKEKLIEKLTGSLNEIKLLRNILPICSICKNIRNDEGYYEQIENYFHKNSGVDFSHTICPQCMKKHYPLEYDQIFHEKKDDDYKT